MILNIPSLQIIPTESIGGDPEYGDLRLIRAQSDQTASANFVQQRYQFQHETDYTVVRATLARKGMIDPQQKNYRLVAITHPNLKQFVNMVRYDPSDPPLDDYDGIGMKAAHDQTQSDFKGQKQQNRTDFRDYLLESIDGQRTPYLPMISGWQTSIAFGRTVFVAFDEDDPNALYGMLYLPKLPIMQADGQTQTAALFGLAKTKDAVSKGAMDRFLVTLEIELNVNERGAGQSFADRNGRGSKKNKNLVIGLDTSSAMSDLRVKATTGTVFESRLATGRNTQTTETATQYIVDLSTMEQMLLYVIADNKLKPEEFKHYHVKYFEKYAREFIQMLDELFAKDWKWVKGGLPPNQDPFRRLYVHGWPFALKALASAYHRSRIDELGPLAAAIHVKDASKTFEEAFLSKWEEEKANWSQKPTVSFEELKQRLSQIDWLRHRKHWIAITGAKTKDGKKRTLKLRSIGEERVQAFAQNTKVVIDAVRGKILSDTWTELCQPEDEPLPIEKEKHPIPKVA